MYFNSINWNNDLLLFKIIKLFSIYKKKTIRELNIKDWSGYFFEEMINILDIDPECFMINDTKCIDERILYNICYSDKISVPHIVFNNIECYFLKKMITIIFQFYVIIKKKIYDKYLFKNY